MYTYVYTLSMFDIKAAAYMTKMPYAYVYCDRYREM